MRDFANIRLSPLARAEAEGREVSRLAKDAGWKTLLVTGADATEGALTKLRSPGILHLATHGFFLDGKNEPAGRGAEKERGLSVKPVQFGFEKSSEGAVPRSVLEEEILGPMHRSGLALAGAQKPLMHGAVAGCRNPPRTAC